MPSPAIPIERNPPRLRYCGVTLELAHPGRFDTRGELVSGPSSYALAEALAPLKLSRYVLDIRTKLCRQPYLAGTRVVILAGEACLAKINQPREKLNTLRGSPFSFNGIVYIPTYHPQDAVDLKNFESRLNPHVRQEENQQQSEEDDADREGDAHVKDLSKTARRNYRFWFLQDVRKAIRIARVGYQPNKATYHTNLTGQQILSIMATKAKASATNAGKPPLFLDIETDPRSGRMLCFAFSFDAKDIYSVPIIDHTGSLARPATDLREILRHLAGLFASHTVVAHNSLFDLFLLAWRYRIPPPPQDSIYDTMIAQARIHVDVEKSLGHCVSLYTEQPYHKDEGNFFPSNFAQYKQLLEYNAKDVETMALVYEEQIRQCSTDPGLQASVRQGNALVRPLLLKSLRGIPVNTSALCQRIDELNQRAGYLERNVINKLAGGPCNPRSPKQVADLLYEKFKLPKSLDPTLSLTGKDALYKLALKYPLPILKAILHVRHCSKEVGALGCKLWRESYVTCSYVITGTKTFRLSSRALLGTWGTNLQNWKKRTRRMVIARPGWCLVQVDQAGAEALIVAYLAPAGRYRDLFIHKVNPHAYTAARLFPEVWKAELGYDIQYLFEMPVADAKQDPRWPEILRCIKASDNDPGPKRYYYLGKKTNHSGNYGVGGARLSMSFLQDTEGAVNVPAAEAQRFLDVYNNDLYPEIPGGFQAGVRLDLINKAELRNLFGYPRRFVGNLKEPSHSLLKDAYSWIPQSTVGCITCIADSALQKRVDACELNCEILQNGHDSLLIHCPQEIYKEVAQEVCKAMNQRLVSPRGEEFFMRSDASVGENWYEMSEIKE